MPAAHNRLVGGADLRRRLRRKPHDKTRRLTYLLVTEPTGACSHELTRLLRAISKAVGLPGIYDSTVYGSSRASPRSFFPHHLAAISSAIVHKDALILVNHGSNLSFQLTLPSLAPNVRTRRPSPKPRARG